MKSICAVLISVLGFSLYFIGCGSGGGSSASSSTSGARQANTLLNGLAVTTLAGAAGTQSSTDGQGLTASFNFPMGIATDGINLYVADTINNTIRKIVISSGEVTTLAGTAGISGSVDGTGAAASFNYPSGLTTDGTNLFVADAGNMTIRKIVIFTGEVTTLAGSAGIAGSAEGTGAAARFGYPMGITMDNSYLYVSDNINNTIRRIVISTGQVTTLAGTAGLTGGSSDGIGSAARFNYPSGIATDGVNLYVADAGNMTIRKIVIASGQVTTLAGIVGLPGSADGIGSAASFSCPDGIATDGSNLYVADAGNMTIRRIIISTGEVTTLAGDAGVPGSSDGLGNMANFSAPWGITTDGTDLFVADTYSNTIRKLFLN